VSYEGRVLKHIDDFRRGYVVVYVLSDERDEKVNLRKITVLTLDDVGYRFASDQTWWWFYDADQGLEPHLWEVVL